jgi:hypothetical protein
MLGGLTTECVVQGVVGAGDRSAKPDRPWTALGAVVVGELTCRFEELRRIDRNRRGHYRSSCSSRSLGSSSPGSLG